MRVVTCYICGSENYVVDNVIIHKHYVCYDCVTISYKLAKLFSKSTKKSSDTLLHPDTSGGCRDALRQAEQKKVSNMHQKKY